MSRQLAIFADLNTRPRTSQLGEPVRKSSRKSPAGISTNQLVFTAYQGTNEDVFPQVISLYVAPGRTVADVTYGKGVFWKRAQTCFLGLRFFRLIAATGAIEPQT